MLAQAAGTRVTVTIETSSPVPDVQCDASQLDMALVNLVVNARHAMGGAGHVNVRVFPCEQAKMALPRALARATATFVCLSVQDNGPGMNEEVKKRAVEPLYTTKGEAGTGLGLSQVYAFMEQLGGSMTIDSGAGRGTTIHLFFPVASSESPERD